MTSTPQILAFAAVVGLGAMSPGPDFAVVVRRAAVSGRRSGMTAALGIAAGVFAWVCAAALVVTALWFVVVAGLVGSLRRLFARPGVRRAIDGVTGAALVALGVELAVTRV